MFSHRLGPDFITTKPKILGLSPLRKVAQPKSRKNCANRTLPKLCLDIGKKCMLKKKVKQWLSEKDIVQHLGFHSPKSRPIFSSKRLKYFPKRISPPPPPVTHIHVEAINIKNKSWARTSAPPASVFEAMHVIFVTLRHQSFMTSLMTPLISHFTLINFFL